MSTKEKIAVKVIYPGKEVVEIIEVPFYCKTNIHSLGDGLLIIDKRGKTVVSLETGEYKVTQTDIRINDYNKNNELTQDQAQEILKKAVTENWHHDDLFK